MWDFTLPLKSSGCLHSSRMLCGVSWLPTNTTQDPRTAKTSALDTYEFAPSTLYQVMLSARLHGTEHLTLHITEKKSKHKQQYIYIYQHIYHIYVRDPWAFITEGTQWDISYFTISNDCHFEPINLSPTLQGWTNPLEIKVSIAQTCG